MVTLQEVKAVNVAWFSPENKRFFGDIKYFILLDSEGNPFLIRLTNAWSDMFDGIKKPVYRINKIEDGLKIGSLFDEQFKTLEEVKTFLKD